MSEYQNSDDYLCDKCRHRVVLPAFSHGVCENCGRPFVCPNSPADKLCLDCAIHLGRCVCCGAPI